jgi:hypothetical protein
LTSVNRGVPARAGGSGPTGQAWIGVNRRPPVDVELIQSVFFFPRRGNTRHWMNLRRMRFLWLALAVAVLNAGVPLLGYAALAGHDGPVRVICTPTGMKTIVVDANGQVHTVDAQPSHGGHCALCAMPAALPAPQATLPAPGTAACAVDVVAPTAYLPCFTAATPPATGPPALA